MGVHDRTYMRREGGWRPVGGIPVIGWVLIAHVAGLILHAAAANWFRRPIEEWTVLTWPALREGRVWTALTHPLSGPLESLGLSWLVLLWVVWFFGKIVQDWLGADRCAAFLALALVSGGATFAVAHATGVAATVGGARAATGLNGVAAACIVFAAGRDPRRTIGFWFVQVPLWLFAALWLALDVASVLRLTRFSSPSLWVDLGAAACAFAAARWDALVPDVPAWRAAMSRRRARRNRERAAADDAATRARVDALLERISKDGLPSLTESEREFLKEASRRY